MGDALPVPVAEKRKRALRCGLGTQVWLPANAVVKKHPGQKRNVQKLFPHNQHLGKWLVGKTVGQEKVTTNSTVPSALTIPHGSSAIGFYHRVTSHIPPKPYGNIIPPGVLKTYGKCLWGSCGYNN